MLAFPQVANLWLIIIGGSIINKLDPFINDPGSIVDLLGVSVPDKSQVRWVDGLAFERNRVGQKSKTHPGDNIFAS